MNNYECWSINGYDLEYLDDTHTYLVNGVEVPSITQILSIKFGNKYKGIAKEVLDRAAQKGTEVHKKIEDYYQNNIDDPNCIELRNMKFLQKHYKFEVVANEIPIILFKNDKPIAAGRLDLVLKMNDIVGGGDIKRTSGLDKHYLAYQLNLYRIGYRQCYGVEWKFLKGFHLRENVRKFVDIPVNENMAWALIEEYLGSKNEVL